MEYYSNPEPFVRKHSKKNPQSTSILALIYSHVSSRTAIGDYELRRREAACRRLLQITNYFFTRGRNDLPVHTSIIDYSPSVGKFSSRLTQKSQVV